MMKLRTLGKTDIKISPIIMGTWQAGKSMWVGIEDDNSRKAIRGAFDAGITTFDTAIAYGDGHSERILGETLKSVRDKVILATKVFSDRLAFDQVIASCHESLTNLDTDHIDLYQIHWPSGSFRNPNIVPIEETMRALMTLKTSGKIRAIGVSNFSLTQLIEAQQYGEIASIQPPYSLFWRHVEHELQPYCAEQNISILAYSPLAQGLLTGKFKVGHQFEEGDHRVHNKLFKEPLLTDALQAVSELAPIAAKYKTSISNLALAWLIAQPQTAAIAGARHVTQAQENAKAGELEISDSDLAAIDKIGQKVSNQVKEDSFTHTFMS